MDTLAIGIALAAPQGQDELARTIVELAMDVATSAAWLYLEEPGGLLPVVQNSPTLDLREVGEQPLRGGGQHLIPLHHDGSRVGALVLERGTADPAPVESLAPMIAAALASAAVYRTLEEMVERDIAAAVTREQAIQLILDNMHEGLLAVALDGHATEVRSRAVHEWLGEPPDGEPIWAWLAGDQPEVLESFELNFEQLSEDIMPFELSAAQMPKRIARGECTYGLRYTRVEEAGEFARVLIVIEDITVRLRAERDECALREMEQVISALLRNVDGFRQGIKEIQGLVGAIPGADEPVVRARLLHTIKGSGASLGFHTFANEIHQLEDRDLAAWTDDDSRQAEDSWARAIEKLLPLLGGEESGVSLYPEEYEEFLRLLDRVGGPPELVSAARAWQAPNVGATFGRFAMTARHVAEETGKRVRVFVRGAHSRIRGDHQGPVVSALIHALRNAVHHGVETVAERIAAGKPEVATIELHAEDRGDSLHLRIVDDGRGVDLDAVRQVAERAGVPPSASLFDCMCAGSTAASVNLQAGRGVGLAALRDAVLAVGGSATVRSVVGKGMELALALPTKIAALDQPLAHPGPA